MNGGESFAAMGFFCLYCRIAITRSIGAGPATTIEHIKNDYEDDASESDLTHLDEVLSLHDLSRDPGAGTAEQFRNRCLNNTKFRAIHHHVFVPGTPLEILREGGFSIVRQDVVKGNAITLGKAIDCSVCA